MKFNLVAIILIVCLTSGLSDYQTEFSFDQLNDELTIPVEDEMVIRITELDQAYIKNKKFLYIFDEDAMISYVHYSENKIGENNYKMFSSPSDQTFFSHSNLRLAKFELETNSFYYRSNLSAYLHFLLKPAIKKKTEDQDTASNDEPDEKVPKRNLKDVADEEVRYARVRLFLSEHHIQLEENGLINLHFMFNLSGNRFILISSLPDFYKKLYAYVSIQEEFNGQQIADLIIEELEVSDQHDLKFIKSYDSTRLVMFQFNSLVNYTFANSDSNYVRFEFMISQDSPYNFTQGELFVSFENTSELIVGTPLLIVSTFPITINISSQNLDLLILSNEFISQLELSNENGKIESQTTKSIIIPNSKVGNVLNISYNMPPRSDRKSYIILKLSYGAIVINSSAASLIYSNIDTFYYLIRLRSRGDSAHQSFTQFTIEFSDAPGSCIGSLIIPENEQFAIPKNQTLSGSACGITTMKQEIKYNSRKFNTKINGLLILVVYNLPQYQNPPEIKVVTYKCLNISQNILLKTTINTNINSCLLITNYDIEYKNLLTLNIIKHSITQNQSFIINSYDLTIADSQVPISYSKKIDLSKIHFLEAEKYNELRIYIKSNFNGTVYFNFSVSLALEQANSPKSFKITPDCNTFEVKFSSYEASHQNYLLINSSIEPITEKLSLADVLDKKNIMFDVSTLPYPLILKLPPEGAYYNDLYALFIDTRYHSYDMFGPLQANYISPILSYGFREYLIGTSRVALLQSEYNSYLSLHFESKTEGDLKRFMLKSNMFSYYNYKTVFKSDFSNGNRLKMNSGEYIILNLNVNFFKFQSILIESDSSLYHIFLSAYHASMTSVSAFSGVSKIKNNTDTYTLTFNLANLPNSNFLLRVSVFGLQRELTSLGNYPISEVPNVKVRMKLNLDHINDTWMSYSIGPLSFSAVIVNKPCDSITYEDYQFDANIKKVLKIKNQIYVPKPTKKGQSMLLFFVSNRDFELLLQEYIDVDLSILDTFGEYFNFNSSRPIIFRVSTTSISKLYNQWNHYGLNIRKNFATLKICICYDKQCSIDNQFNPAEIDMLIMPQYNNVVKVLDRFRMRQAEFIYIHLISSSKSDVFLESNYIYTKFFKDSYGALKMDLTDKQTNYAFSYSIKQNKSLLFKFRPSGVLVFISSKSLKFTLQGKMNLISSPKGVLFTLNSRSEIVELQMSCETLEICDGTVHVGYIHSFSQSNTRFRFIKINDSIKESYMIPKNFQMSNEKFDKLKVEIISDMCEECNVLVQKLGLGESININNSKKYVFIAVDLLIRNSGLEIWTNSKSDIVLLVNLLEEVSGTTIVESESYDHTQQLADSNLVSVILKVDPNAYPFDLLITSDKFFESFFFVYLNSIEDQGSLTYYENRNHYTKSKSFYLEIRENRAEAMFLIISLYAPESSTQLRVVKNPSEKLDYYFRLQQPQYADVEADIPTCKVSSIFTARINLVADDAVICLKVDGVDAPYCNAFRNSSCSGTSINIKSYSIITVCAQNYGAYSSGNPGYVSVSLSVSTSTGEKSFSSNPTEWTCNGLPAVNNSSGIWSPNLADAVVTCQATLPLFDECIYSFDTVLNNKDIFY